MRCGERNQVEMQHCWQCGKQLAKHLQDGHIIYREVTVDGKYVVRVHSICYEAARVTAGEKREVPENPTQGVTPKLRGDQ